MRSKTTFAESLKSGVVRGHVQIHLSLRSDAWPAASGGREPPTAGSVHASLSRGVRASIGSTSQPDLNAALRIPGMLANGSDAELDEDVAKAILEATAEAVAALNQFPRARGRCHG